MLNIIRCVLTRQAQWHHAHVRSSFESWAISKNLLVTSANPRSAVGGGGLNITPAPVLSRLLKNDSRYLREFFSTLSGINLTPSNKIQKNPLIFYWRKWRFSDVMFRDFESKSGKCLQASKMCTYEVKHNPWTPKDVKCSALQSTCLEF